MKDKEELNFLHLASTVKALSMSISGPWKATHHHVKAVFCSSVCLGCTIFQRDSKGGVDRVLTQYPWFWNCQRQAY